MTAVATPDAARLVFAAVAGLILLLIPITTEDYDEQEFDKSRIMNVFEVIGSISKFCTLAERRKLSRPIFLIIFFGKV